MTLMTLMTECHMTLTNVIRLMSYDIQS